MKHITTADALRALEEAVAEKGEDYRYDVTDGCVYVEGDQPSCIAGNALARLGVPIEDMLRFNAGWGVTSLARELDLSIDDRARAALDIAQELQDEGAPWGVGDKAMDRGVTAVEMTHAAYVAEVSPKLAADYRCPHEAVTA